MFDFLCRLSLNSYRDLGVRAGSAFSVLPSVSVSNPAQ
jgi:hypothetical protein